MIIINRKRFIALKKRIRAYIDSHPFDRSEMAQAVGGVDKYGGITEDFLVACASVFEDLCARHDNN